MKFYCVILFILIAFSLTKADYNTSLIVSVNSTSHIVTVNVSCSSASNNGLSVNVLYAVWLGNNSRKSYNTTTINNSLPTGKTQNWSDPTLLFGSNSVDNTTNLTSFNIPAEALWNAANNYNIIVYCVDNNSVVSNSSSATWNQPDNGGAVYEIDVTYNATLDVSVFTRQQVQAVWKALSGISYDHVVDVTGDIANGSTTSRLLVTTNTTTLTTYILPNLLTANDTTGSLIPNMTVLSDKIQGAMNSTGYNYTNATVLSVSQVKLPRPVATLTSGDVNTSTINLNIGTTVSGQYYVVGTTNTSFNGSYLSSDNIKNHVTDTGVTFSWFTSGVITPSALKTVSFAGLTDSTKLLFFAVVDNGLYNSTLSNIVSLIASTSAIIPNTSNSTTYNASVSASVDKNTSLVTINLNCTQVTTSGLFYITYGSKNPDFNTGAMNGNTQTTNFNWINAKTIYARVQNVAVQYTLTVDAKNLINEGNGYAVVAVCQNVTGGTTNYSTPAYVNWIQPDNGGNNYKIVVNYNQTPTAVNSTIQAQAISSLLPNIPTNLIGTTTGTLSKVASSSLRLLDSTSTSSLVTYVYRNYSLISDTTGSYINTTLSNQSTVVQSIQKYYASFNITADNVSNFSVVSLNNPIATLSLVNASTSTSIMVTIGSNVDGNFSVCLANSTYDPSQLQNTDLINCLDDSANALNAAKYGVLITGVSQNVSFINLNSNTKYQVFAIVQDNLPVASTSPYQRLFANTTSSTNGTYGEKLFYGLSILVVLLMGLLWN